MSSWRPYNCVHCMAPSESTYRRYGSEIKLTTCDMCGQNVDSYVERDGLLVAIDCILLREQAYRHILCNNSQIRNVGVENSHQKGKDEIMDKTTMLDTSQIAQFFVASTIIQAYILLQEGFDHGMDPTAECQNLLLLSLFVSHTPMLPCHEQKIRILPLLIYCSLGNILIWFGIQVGFWLSMRNTNQAERHIHLQRDRLLSRRLGMATLLPTAFHIITMLVMIWENTTMVRRLSSLLVLYYQYVSTTTAMQLDYVTVNSAYTSSPSRISFLWAFLSGILFRLIGFSVYRWVCLANSSSETAATIPCLLGIDTLVDLVQWMPATGLVESDGSAIGLEDLLAGPSWMNLCIC